MRKREGWATATEDCGRWYLLHSGFGTIRRKSRSSERDICYYYKYKSSMIHMVHIASLLFYGTRFARIEYSTRTHCHFITLFQRASLPANADDRS